MCKKMLTDRYLFPEVIHQPTSSRVFFKFTFTIVPQQEDIFSNMLVMIFLHAY